MTILRLAYRSLLSRKFTGCLTIFSIALSMLLLVSIDRIRQGTQTGFEGTLSQTDLVVGARGGSLPLLLYAVFHIGTANNEISWDSYQRFAHHPAVLWTIPLAMGDSHRGFRVVATDDNFYEHYRYRGDQSLHMAEGVRAEHTFDAVLGSSVAAQLHYHLGQKLILSHGLEASFIRHTATPYTVVGILAHTATPVDRAIYITLQGDEAMHFGWTNGAPPLGSISASTMSAADLRPRSISAFLLRTRSRIGTLFLQREINTYQPEPLTAVIPAMTLEDLWGVLSSADIALSLVSGAVLVVSLMVMLTALYTALNERRREIAILRTLGLHIPQIFALFVLESALISTLGAVLGVAAAYAFLFAIRIPVENRFGIPLTVTAISPRIAAYVVGVAAAGFLLGFIPAIRAYRNALVDGLNAG